MLISPFHRTHELLISPPRFSIKKEKKQQLDVDSTTSCNKSIDPRPRPLSSLKRDPNHCLSISLLKVINALLLTQSHDLLAVQKYRSLFVYFFSQTWTRVTSLVACPYFHQPKTKHQLLLMRQCITNFFCSIVIYITDK